ncbi:MAG TPA: methyltransferase domain-containing protein [Actinoplanes sp.]
MIDGALPYLRCPVCRRALGRAGRALRCAGGHSFDMARQGYADLTAGRMPHVGDTAEMVADRADFLAAGHYDFIADALADAAENAVAVIDAAKETEAEAEAAADAAAAAAENAEALADAAKNTEAPAMAAGMAAPATRDGLVVDAGTGTGHYLRRVLDAIPGAAGLGLDVSKPALRRAARCHPRAAAVLADLWRPLPIADRSADVLLNVFAPRNGPEFHRILRSDGVLLVVTPTADHLRELIEAHGLIHVDPDKTARVGTALGDHFRPDGAVTLRRKLMLTPTEARTLIGMTPSAHHVPAAGPTGPGEPTTVTAAVDLTVYRPA